MARIGGSRFYVLTNRKNLDAFTRAGGKLDDLVMGVGILSGKPKYPPGHVGARSRDAKRERYRRAIGPGELQRRQMVRIYRRQVSQIKDKSLRKQRIKELRRAFKEQGLSSRGLARAVTRGTAVARVAGVLQGTTGAGLRSPYHVRAMKARGAATEHELEQVAQAMIRRGNFTRELKQFGQNNKNAVRQSFQATGHGDTGKLFRNIQYQIASKGLKKQWQAEQRALRAESRRLRAMKKAARRAR